MPTSKESNDPFAFWLVISMKVLQLNHSDSSGGAARAAYRIHNAIRDIGISSKMLVNVAYSGDWTVQGPPAVLIRLLLISARNL